MLSFNFRITDAVRLPEGLSWRIAIEENWSYINQSEGE
jgi:hypothetical protein